MKLFARPSRSGEIRRRSITLASSTFAATLKVLVAHPDKGGSDAEFQRVQTAFEVLSDPSAKKKYDEELRGRNTVIGGGGEYDLVKQGVPGEKRVVVTLVQKSSTLAAKSSAAKKAATTTLRWKEKLASKVRAPHGGGGQQAQASAAAARAGGPGGGAGGVAATSSKKGPPPLHPKAPSPRFRRQPSFPAATSNKVPNNQAGRGAPTINLSQLDMLRAQARAESLFSASKSAVGTTTQTAAGGPGGAGVAGIPKPAGVGGPPTSSRSSSSSRIPSTGKNCPNAQAEDRHSSPLISGPFRRNHNGPFPSAPAAASPRSKGKKRGLLQDDHEDDGRLSDLNDGLDALLVDDDEEQLGEEPHDRRGGLQKLLTETAEARAGREGAAGVFFLRAGRAAGGGRMVMADLMGRPPDARGRGDGSQRGVEELRQKRQRRHERPASAAEAAFSASNVAAFAAFAASPARVVRSPSASAAPVSSVVPPPASHSSVAGSSSSSSAGARAGIFLRKSLTSVLRQSAPFQCFLTRF